MSSPTGRAKPDIRRLLLSRRDALSEGERATYSGAICERARRLVEERCASGSIVALYAHKGSEVETAALDERLRASGFRVAYPRVVDESRVLAFFEVAIDALGATRWGLREPSADATAVAIETIAAFVVPGLAFDRAGGRMGWGKGHYDATLTAARADAECIGLAFECQVVENVPRESHDVALDAIITEVATHAVAE
ncbi:MAG: 5-formyltetrahydrofolate cyclo-ligase [Deltaproteobacteria bacterium]|nr:5-formyltetrahydrofolate cyclo-ligase [Deltaproteobacteria bacterium]